MLFNTAAFATFFFLFFVLFHFISDRKDYKLWLILVASVVFYGSFNPFFIPVLLGTGLIDYRIALAIEDSAGRERKQRFLITSSVVMNLGVLAFFKYTSFLLSNVQDLFALFHVRMNIAVLEIAMPLGISFYTFQSISYTLDVYWGKIPAKRRFLEFLASLTFFPHLLAGPIIRSSYLLPQFEKLELPEWSLVRRGCLLIAVGLAKKTVADLLAPVADALFAGGAGASHGALTTWTGVLAFAAQIYGDFSGYTDIAIGLSALLGFSLPENFHLPFLSRSVTEYWRRWHISLSSWLRDYCYTPMALGTRKPHLSIFLTMALCGLWHGPSWTFVLFGVYHGVLLVVEGLWTSRRKGKPAAEGWGTRTLQVVVTFYLVVVGMVIFRARSAEVIWRVLKELHGLGPHESLAYSSCLTLGLVVAAIVLGHVLDRQVIEWGKADKWKPYLWPAAIGLLALSMLLGSSGQSFIYFDF